MSRLSQDQALTQLLHVAQRLADQLELV
jgi:hypothetical protein